MAFYRKHGWDFSRIEKLPTEWGKFKKITPMGIANIILNWFVLGFIKGGGQTDASRGGWKPRKNNKDSGRPILVKTGKLFRDLRRRKTTFKEIIVGTSGKLPYDDAHNEGIGHMPKREYIGESRELERAIEKHLDRQMNKLM